MLKDADNSRGEGDATTDCQTGAREKPAKKRGRPKGSRNRVSADARALLAKHGPAGLTKLCAIAAGRPVYRPRSADGHREKLIPNLDQMLQAQKVIVDRLVPSLKATELTGAEGEPLFAGPTDTRDLARSVLDILRQAQVAEEPGPAPLAPPHPPAAGARVEEEHPSPEKKFAESTKQVFPNHAYVELVQVLPDTVGPVTDRLGARVTVPGVRKWLVADGSGVIHGYRRNRDDAVALAMSLPTMEAAGPAPAAEGETVVDEATIAAPGFTDFASHPRRPRVVLGHAASKQHHRGQRP